MAHHNWFGAARRIARRTHEKVKQSVGRCLICRRWRPIYPDTGVCAACVERAKKTGGTRD